MPAQDTPEADNSNSVAAESATADKPVDTPAADPAVEGEAAEPPAQEAPAAENTVEPETADTVQTAETPAVDVQVGTDVIPATDLVPATTVTPATSETAEKTPEAPEAVNESITVDVDAPVGVTTEADLPIINEGEAKLPEVITDVIDINGLPQLPGDGTDAPGALESEQQKQEQEEGELEQGAAPQVDWWKSGYFTLFVLFLVVIGSGFLASALSALWRMPDHKVRLFVLFFCFFGAVASTILGWHSMTLGIDLRGGVILVYDVAPKKEDPSAIPSGDSEAGKAEKPQVDIPKGKEAVDMEALTKALSMRINPGGVREISITKLGDKQIRIIVPLAEEAEVT
ncbi:MAG: hypothetical protein ACRC2T_10085, partial [Thermoguttaceae bacterium]